MNYCLSLKNGFFEVAKIYEGVKSKGILYINDCNENAIEQDIYNKIMNLSKLLGKYNKINTDKKIIKYLNGQNVDLPDEIEDQIKSMLDQNSKKKLSIEYPFYFQPIPFAQEDQVSHTLVSGATGAGKTNFAARLMLEYHLINPNNTMFIFSKKKEDKALDDLPNTKRVKLDDNFIKFITRDDSFSSIKKNKKNKKEETESESEADSENENGEEKIDILDYFRDSLLLFDDIEQIMNKELVKEVKNFQKLIIECGRSYNIYTINTVHNFDHKKEVLRDIVNECDNIVIFRDGTSIYHVKDFLTRHHGLNNDQVKEINELKSRWILFHKKVPRYIISEHQAFLL